MAAKKPAGVIVSPELFRSLVKEQAIQRRLGTPWGLAAPSLGLELPFYDEDVYVACDPELDDFDYKLPQA